MFLCRFGNLKIALIDTLEGADIVPSLPFLLKMFIEMHLKNNKYLSRLLQLSYVMAGYRYFVCPVEFNNDSNRFTVDCEPSELFQLQDYGLPSVLQSITGWVKHTLTCTRSVRHLLLMSLIWSVLCVFFLLILCLCLSQPCAYSPLTVNVSQLCFTVTVNILWTTKTQCFN